MDKTSSGTQIDLAFDRADHVITLCEIKHRNRKLGLDLIPEIERKLEVLRSRFPEKSILPVLVTTSEVSTKLLNQCYFVKVINAESLFE